MVRLLSLLASSLLFLSGVSANANDTLAVNELIQGQVKAFCNGVNKVQKYTSDVQSFDPQDDQEKEISEALNEMIALSNSDYVMSVCLADNRTFFQKVTAAGEGAANMVIEEVKALFCPVKNMVCTTGQSPSSDPTESQFAPTPEFTAPVASIGNLTADYVNNTEKLPIVGTAPTYQKVPSNIVTIAGDLVCGMMEPMLCNE